MRTQASSKAQSLRSLLNSMEFLAPLLLKRSQSPKDQAWTNRLQPFHANREFIHSHHGIFEHGRHSQRCGDSCPAHQHWSHNYHQVNNLLQRGGAPKIFGIQRFKMRRSSPGGSLDLEEVNSQEYPRNTSSMRRVYSAQKFGASCEDQENYSLYCTKVSTWYAQKPCIVPS